MAERAERVRAAEWKLGRDEERNPEVYAPTAGGCRRWPPGGLGDPDGEQSRLALAGARTSSPRSRAARRSVSALQ